MTAAVKPNFNERMWLRIMGVSLIFYSGSFKNLLTFFGQYWNLGVFIVSRASSNLDNE